MFLSDGDFSEKKFTYFTMIGVIALVIVTVGNLMIRENVVEIIGLILTETAAPVVMLFSLKKGKIQTGGVLIGVCMIFFILPIAFFFGHGGKNRSPERLRLHFIWIRCPGRRYQHYHPQRRRTRFQQTIL